MIIINFRIFVISQQVHFITISYRRIRTVFIHYSIRNISIDILIRVIKENIAKSNAKLAINVITCTLKNFSATRILRDKGINTWNTNDRLVIYAIIRLNADNHTTVTVIAISCRTRTGATLFRVEYGNIKVSVLIAVPSPINMIKSVSVRTVTNKRMTTSRRSSRIHYRTLIQKLIVYYCFPFLYGKRETIKVIYKVGIISEIISPNGNVRVAARNRTIIHLQRRTAMIHKLCHSVSLLVSIVTVRVRVEHIVPIIIRLFIRIYGWNPQIICFCFIRINVRF